MADKENWSWRKFVLGIFDGRNYAKAIILGICGAIVLTICFCVYSVVKSKFIKPKPVQTQSIGTNQGQVTTNNIEETNRGWSLIESFIKFGNTNGSDK